MLIGEVALVMEGYTDPRWVSLGKALCDEALAGLPGVDAPLRARLLARRAAEATYHGEPEAGPLSEEALAMAERLGDPHALRSALRARQLARGGPDGALDRVELGAGCWPWASPTGTTRRSMWGRLWRVDAFAQLGRMGDCSAEIGCWSRRWPGCGRPGRPGTCGGAGRRWRTGGGVRAGVPARG